MLIPQIMLSFIINVYFILFYIISSWNVNIFYLCDLCITCAKNKINPRRAFMSRSMLYYGTLLSLYLLLKYKCDNIISCWNQLTRQLDIGVRFITKLLVKLYLWFLFYRLSDYSHYSLVWSWFTMKRLRAPDCEKNVT